MTFISNYIHLITQINQLTSLLAAAAAAVVVSLSSFPLVLFPWEAVVAADLVSALVLVFPPPSDGKSVIYTEI